MRKILVVAITVTCILLAIQWLSVDGITPETLPVEGLSMEDVSYRHDKTEEASTIPSLNPASQQKVLVQNISTFKF